MNQPQEPERVTFHTTIHGGQQAFASHNARFVQHNYGPAGPQEEFRLALEEIKSRLAELSDPAPAQREVAVVEDELTRRDPESSRVLAALRKLRAIAAEGTALADAVTRAIDLAARFWPF